MEWDEDEDWYRWEEAQQKLIADELQRISEEPVINYLGSNGDAIEARVRLCLEQAQSLNEYGHHGAALVRAAAGIEVTVRYFLAQPLLQGAFLSWEWADLLAERIFRGRTAEEREMLPAILRNWGIDITAVKLASGEQVWEQIVSKVWPHRNAYVHKADNAASSDAMLGIDCLNALLSDVVDPLALKLGFTRQQTGCWSKIAKRFSRLDVEMTSDTTYPRCDPFVST
jgi:hypothetical protein